MTVLIGNVFLFRAFLSPPKRGRAKILLLGVAKQAISFDATTATELSKLFESTADSPTSVLKPLTTSMA
eukprot:2789757-Amphidinium_carterae.1